MVGVRTLWYPTLRFPPHPANVAQIGDPGCAEDGAPAVVIFNRDDNKFRLLMEFSAQDDYRGGGELDFISG